MLIKEEEIKQSKKQENIYSYIEKGEKFIIPFFQRAYSWKEKELEGILKEIEEIIEDKKEQKIYLLRFIFSKKNDNEIFVIDGQQRLITLGLLIKAIIKIIDNNNNNEEELSEFKIEFQSNYDIEKQYEKSNGIFKKNFKYLCGWIKKKEEHLKDIIKIIKKEIIIDYLELDNINKAFNIFYLMNTTGKKLTIEDIIISKIKKIIRDRKEFKNIIEILNKKKIKKWFLIYYSFQFKKMESVFGIEEINEMFEKIEGNEEEIKKFVETIENFKKKEDENKGIMELIKNIGRSEIELFILAIFYKKINIEKSNYDDYFKLFFGLCFLSILMSIKSLNPGGVFRGFFRNIFLSIIEKDKKIDETIEIFRNFITEHEEFKLTYDEFEKRLGSKKVERKIKKAIIHISILLKNKSLSCGHDLELEHILAIKSKEYSKTDEMEKNVFDSLKENIGNLLLLTKDENISLNNKDVDYKINKYKTFFENHKFLNTGINSISCYNFKIENIKKDIIERQKKIVEYIYNKFPYAIKLIIK